MVVTGNVETTTRERASCEFLTSGYESINLIEMQDGCIVGYMSKHLLELGEHDDDRNRCVKCPK